MSSIYDWSVVAANNSNSDAAINWSEGQAPSTVNNSARQLEARVREFITDIAGSIAAGGTANGLTVTAASAFTAYADGMIISFRATASNTGAATLSVNGIGAKAIRKMDAAGDIALIANDIRNTGIYVAQYSAALNGAAGAWLMVNPTQPSAPAAAGHIFGLTLSNNAGDVTNDIDIAVGSAASDDTDPVKMVLASAITKRLDAAWAVGTGNGGLDTGSIANTTYHIFLIKRLDTGVVDALFSASATAPTMPANYTVKRRIGSIIREGGVIVPFFQNGDIFKRVTWIDDRNDTTAFPAALLTLASAPAGIVAAPILGVVLQSGISCQCIISLGSVSAGTIENQVAFALTGAGDTSDGTRVMVPPVYFTNTSKQLYFSQINTTGTPTSSQLFNAGWVDTRGR